MKSKTFFKSLSWIMIIFLFSGSLTAQIRGNGNIVRQTRDVGPFNGIIVRSGIDLFISQTGNPSVEIKSDENLQQYIITEVKDGILYVYVEKNRNIWQSHAMDAYVSIGDIRSLKVSGGGDVASEGTIKSEDLKIVISGGGDLEMNLDATALNLSMSGGGDAEVQGRINDFKAALSGGGDLELDALLETISLTVSGGGDAEIRGDGNVSTADITISGGGDLEMDIPCNNLTIQVSGGGDAEIHAGDQVQKAKISINSGGDLDLVLKTRELSLFAGSGGDAWLKGSCDSFSGEIKSGGDLDASECEMQSAKIDLNGGSGAKLHVTGILDLNASGGGQVYLEGNPHINANLTGGSKLHRK
ncbi:MAG: DUF2807 domain-containing protein [Chlorobi bacterium]|nr:DUF2807 domain-containing protein [Chlorobiota bacterium]